MKKNCEDTVLESADREGEAKIRADEGSGGEGTSSGEMDFDRMSKEELIEQVKTLGEKSEKHYDLYLRSQAEIDNIRKRHQREKQDLCKYSNETLIKQILPVIDHLEMAISHSNNENSRDALREGVELTLKGLKDTLGKAGLEEIKAIGEPFDPCFHEAVSEMEDKKAKAGTVLLELQKGYTLNTRLVRPAKVIVSRDKDKQGPHPQETPERPCENR